MSKNNQEDRLVELAIELDRRLADGGEVIDQLRESNQDLSQEQRKELERAGFALDFLNHLRQQFEPARRSTTDGKTNTPTLDFSHESDQLAATEPLAEVRESSSIGRFDLIRELGQGGFSRVFLATDPQLGRQVAIKIPLPHVLVNESSRKRFEREARAAAILSHPAIVPIFESGSIGPISYIAYGYCPGQDLSEWFEAEGRDISFRTAAAILARLAEATEHAHQRGIVHRDLKPANVLLQVNSDESRDDSAEFSRQVADGVRITDFGLAQLDSHEDESLTVEGSIVGTPAYMSPEQARGDENVTASSDIFSLGSVFYELLTGELAFKKSTNLATLRAIEEENPRAPRSIRPTIPRDLEAICLKCLRKAPEQRYASAHHLAADLERWLNGLTVLARPASSFEKLIGWGKRNPRLAIAIAIACIAVVGGLLGTTWQWKAALANARVANEERNKVIAAKAETDRANKDYEGFTNFFVNEVLAASRPVGTQGGQGKDVTLLEAINAVEPKIAAQCANEPRVEAKIRNSLGSTYRLMGETERAADQFQAVMTLGSRLGEKDEQFIQANVGYANILFTDGRHDEAAKQFEEAFRLAKTHLGEENMLTFACLNNLAAVLVSQMEFENAIPRFEELLDIAKRKHGPKHPITSLVLRNLAVSLRFVGEYSRAIRLLSDQLAWQTKQLGENNYETIRTMSELGDSYTSSGQPELGTELVETALAKSREILSPTHPRSFDFTKYWARNLYYRNEIEQGEEVFAEAIRISSERFGPSHKITNDLAIERLRCCSLFGDPADTAQIVVEMMKGHRQRGNRQQELRLVPYHVQALRQTGKTDKAIDVATNYLPEVKQEMGEHHDFTMQLERQLASSLTAGGRWSEAIVACDSALKSLRTLDSPRAQVFSIDLLEEKATCLKQLGKTKELEETTKELAAIQSANDARSSDFVAKPMN